MTTNSKEIVDFWFGNALTTPEEYGPRAILWFSQNDDFDRDIQIRFGSLSEQAARGKLDAWRKEASSALALVLVLDQFPRNLYRSSARAFEFDPLARDMALEAVSSGFDKALHPLQAVFLYLPLEHAEDIELQNRSVQLFTQLAAEAPSELRTKLELFTSFAQRHHDVINRFGRFPHRNEVLDRHSTPAEIAYLESGGDTFG